MMLKCCQVVMLFCIFCQISANQLPEICFTPFSAFKPRSTVTLSCKTPDQNFESIQYTRNDIVISPTTDKRISRGAEYTLVISLLNNRIDDGEYRCIVQSNRGKLRSLKKLLRVKTLGSFQQSFKYTDPVRIVDVVVGRGFTLQCPSASYTYPKNILWGNVPPSGQPVILAENKRRFKLSNGNLMFTYVTENEVNEINQLRGVSCIFYHNGPYVQSVRQNLRKVAELRNNFGPSFTESIPAKTEANEGQQLKFACSAYGRPTPRIVWTGPKGRIDITDTDYRISRSGNILTIPVVYSRLAGKYRCDAENSISKIKSEGELVVNASPSWDKKLQDVQAKANTAVTLSVTTIGSSGSNVVQYDWFKNGKRISISNSSYVVNGNSITINNVQPNDFGYVQVFASYKGHEIASTAFLNVEGAVIPPGKKIKKKVYYEYYILIGVAGLIILGVIAFIIYKYLKK